MPWGIYISIEATSSQSECEVLPVKYEEDTKDQRAYVFVDTLYTKKKKKRSLQKMVGKKVRMVPIIMSYMDNTLCLRKDG